MIVVCPNCGKSVEVKGLGRRRLNISVKNVLDCLCAQRNVSLAAVQLGCSPAYIFGVLRTNGLTLKDVLPAARLVDDKTGRPQLPSDRHDEEMVRGQKK